MCTTEEIAANLWSTSVAVSEQDAQDLSIENEITYYLPPLHDLWSKTHVLIETHWCNKTLILSIMLNKKIGFFFQYIFVFCKASVININW